MVAARNSITLLLGLLVSLSAAVVGSAAFTATTPSRRIIVVPSTRLHSTPPVTQQEDDAPQTNNDDVQDIPRGGAGLSNSPLPKKLPDLPTLAAYRKFALPCFGLWVSGPLLSLVDTAFIGLSGPASESAKQLAALGPATTFFDGATYLFAFLNVATTNLYSSAKARTGDQSDESEGVVRTASKVAITCGFGIMLFILTVSRPLLKLYIGHEVEANPYLLNSAVDYVNIRAFSLPTSLLLGVVQAALLGSKDSVTPLIAVAYQTVINLFGDFLLVNRLGMGLKGAAIATLAAQLVSTIALLAPARKKLIRNQKFEFFKKSDKKTPTSTITAKSFLAFAAPVLTLILGKLAAFGFMTHSAAAVPGQPLPLASHQIILSLFFFVSPFLEVISQTAQTFLPAYFTPINDHIASKRKRNANYNPEDDERVQTWIGESRRVAASLSRLGIVVGSVVASVISLIPALFGNFLTTDTNVQAILRPLAKFLFAGGFLTAPVAVSEGILLARRELKFLASVYLLSTALLPSALIQVKRIGGSVEQIWACFAAFQLFRAVSFGGKIWGGALVARLFRRKEQES